MHKKKTFLLIGIILVVLLCGRLLFGALQLSPFFFQLLFNKNIDLKKTTSNHINILLLGIGGGAHDGPNLTDTVIFMSIDPKTKKIDLVSIPRDLWVPDIPGKVNTAYAFGEEKVKGGGLKLAKAVVSKILGQPVDYGVRIDFDGFVKAIDLVGGLDIYVDNVLDDYEYPIEGKENETCGYTEEELITLATASSQLDAFPCRYKHIHFDKGLQHMNGKTALEYVRSRHAEGQEGSDFARSKRQEKLINSFKNKVFSLETFFNPAKILGLYGTLKDSIDTDIKQDEFDDFIRLAQQLKGVKMQSATIDIGDEAQSREGLLEHPLDPTPFGGQWVLAPKAGNGDFSEIQKYVRCYIAGTCPTPTPTPGANKK